MKNKSTILRILIPILLLFSTTKIIAQQTHVDEVISLLKKSNTPKGLDTITFKAASKLMIVIVLNNEQITQIEKVGQEFKKGNEEDLC